MRSKQGDRFDLYFLGIFTAQRKMFIAYAYLDRIPKRSDPYDLYRLTAEHTKVHQTCLEFTQITDGLDDRFLFWTQITEFQEISFLSST